MHILTPVSDIEKITAEQTLRSLLDQGCYVFSSRTGVLLRNMSAGDRICFYRTGTGVVAEALATGPLKLRSVKFVREQWGYPWVLPVKDVRYFFDNPIVLDAAKRKRLDAFRHHDAEYKWGWFLMTTRILSERDYKILTGR
jgi:hypothetical protein